MVTRQDLVDHMNYPGQWENTTLDKRFDTMRVRLRTVEIAPCCEVCTTKDLEPLVRWGFRSAAGVADNWTSDIETGKEVNLAQKNVEGTGTGVWKETVRSEIGLTVRRREWPLLAR
jgi:hypothetical protein